MTKNMPEKGLELIVYQISEVQKGVSAMSVKFDAFQERIDARVATLEQWRAVLEAQSKENPKDGFLFSWIGENAMSKIAILALTIAVGVITLVSNGVIK